MSNYVPFTSLDIIRIYFKNPKESLLPTFHNFQNNLKKGLRDNFTPFTLFCAKYVFFFKIKNCTYLLFDVSELFLVGIHSMQGWTATTRHIVT